jgi:hypothetical protein
MTDSTEKQFSDARVRFREFHFRDPNPNNLEIINIAGLARPTIGLAVGEFLAITYKSVGDGETYTHDFKATNRPLVYTTPDGQQIYILKGGYRFTGRGFIG